MLLLQNQGGVAGTVPQRISYQHSKRLEKSIFWGGAENFVSGHYAHRREPAGASTLVVLAATGRDAAVDEKEAVRELMEEVRLPSRLSSATGAAFSLGAPASKLLRADIGLRGE